MASLGAPMGLRPEALTRGDGLLNLQRIRIGRYFPVSSPIHSLHPGVKMICSVILLVGAFATDKVLGLLLLILAVFALIYLAKLPPWRLIGSLRTVAVLLTIAALAQLLLTPGRELLHLGFITVTESGLKNAYFYTFRLVVAVLVLGVLTMTTDELNMLRGLEYLLKPLKALRLPVEEITMVLFAALRFLPLLITRAQEISAAQRARGARPGTRSLRRKIAFYLSLVVPLVHSGLKDAEEVGTALAARGYTGGSLLPGWKNNLSPSDGLALLFTAGIVAASLFIPW